MEYFVKAIDNNDLFNAGPHTARGSYLYGPQTPNPKLFHFQLERYTLNKVKTSVGSANILLGH